MKYLSICSIVKDEDLFPDIRGKTYIDDFVEFHRFIGVEHFTLFDRGFRLVERFKGCKDVTVVHFPEPALHAECWQAYIQGYALTSYWTALIDVDQFLLPENLKDARQSLSVYEHAEVGAIQFNWKTFGSAGYDKKPACSQFEAFIKREDEARCGHSVLTQSVLKAGAGNPSARPHSPHHLQLLPGYISINAEGRILEDKPTSDPISYTNLSIAHYLTRSREEWVFKCSKGRADVAGGFVPVEEFEKRNNGINEVEDLQALKIFSSYC